MALPEQVVVVAPKARMQPESVLTVPSLLSRRIKRLPVSLTYAYAAVTDAILA